MEIANEKYEIVVKGTRDVVREIDGPFKLTTSGQIDYWRKQMSLVDTTDNRKYSKVFFECLSKSIKDIRPSSVTMALTLGSYIAFGTNKLTHCNGKPLHTKDIMKICNRDKKFTLKALEELVGSQIFARVAIGNSYEYFANPHIFLMGKGVDKWTLSLFKGYRTIEV